MIATIFLGPTMPRHKAQEIVPTAIYRPPAAQGDLISAVNQDGADVIGLIDGTFHQTLSVWHSEVCYLLARGVAVFGASSMGALRAVETERYGTVGVGTIFEWYRDGTIAGDDEVALVHADEDDEFRAMSLVLVNIRASLNQAVARGLLDTLYADKAIEIARATYYPDRQVPTILSRCRDLGFPPDALQAIKRALTVDHVDLKRADATEMLTLVEGVLTGSISRPPRVEFEFNRSGVFETLYNLDRRIRTGDTQVSLQSIREHAALHRPEYEGVRRAALDRAVVCYFASLLGLRATPADIAKQESEFLADRRLDTPDAVQQWLRTNGMSEADFTEYCAEEALCSRMRRWVTTSRGMDRACRAVLDEARRRGAFEEWAEEAADEESIVATYGFEAEYVDFWHEDPRRLAALHNENSSAGINDDVRAWAEDAGFDDVADVVDALRRSAIYYDVKARIARLLRALDRAEDALSTPWANDSKRQWN